MKLLTILLFIVLLSNNYVMSQTICPKNGTQINGGTCYYLTKEECPHPWNDTGIIENDVDYATISDLLRTTKTRERVCMPIYDTDMKQILDRQPKYMKTLREENQILLEKPIGDDESLYIAFKIKDEGEPASIVIQDSSEEDIYFGKIIIAKGKLQVSSSTDIVAGPEVISFQVSSDKLYQLDIRFTANKIQVIESSEHTKLIEIDLWLNSIYSANMVSIENIDVYQLEHHDMKCQSEETFSVNEPKKPRDSEKSLLTNGYFERDVNNDQLQFHVRKMPICLGSDRKTSSHKISLSHPCDMDDIKNGCKFHKSEITITSGSSYITAFRYLQYHFLSKYCFSDYWIPEISTKVPYQSDCGTEKHLNICRIKRDVHTESYEPISTESSISDEQDDKLTKSEVFSGVVKPKQVSVVTPCFLLAICVFLNLINVAFECVLR